MRAVSGGGRWLLLLALAAGLIGMHHLAATGSPSHETGHTAAAEVVSTVPDTVVPDTVIMGASDPGMAMAMHMCLAVLGAVALLGLLLLLGVAVLTRRPPAASPGAVVLHPARPPPRSAVRLALLCVLRN